MENQKKTRRQVSFNIDDKLYTEYKKLMLDEGRTPTGDITRYILSRVEKAKELAQSKEMRKNKVHDEFIGFEELSDEELSQELEDIRAEMFCNSETEEDIEDLLSSLVDD